MKYLILPLLAALVLPTAVNAETWWLMAAGRHNKQAGSTSYTWSIPTSSETECEIAGKKFINDWDEGLAKGQYKSSLGYVCVKGK